MRRFAIYRPQPQLLDVPQVLERLSISKTRLYKMIADGSAPPSLTIGRRRLFSELELNEWIREQCEGQR